METIDLSILGELRLNKIDYIISDVCSLRDSLAWTFGSGLLGSIGKLDFDPLLQSGSFGLPDFHTNHQKRQITCAHLTNNSVKVNTFTNQR